MQKRPFCIHTHQNRRYFSPETEVMGISTEGMVCTSIVTDSLIAPEYEDGGLLN